MEEIKQENIQEIKQEDKVETPNYDNIFKEINEKLDNLTRENTALKEEVINLKNKPMVETTQPKKVERSLKFIKEIF